MFDTYTNLLAEIGDWLGNRTELTAKYPSFITLAEQRMYRNLRAPEMIEYATALLTEEYEELPFNSIAVISVAASPGNQSDANPRRVRLTAMSNNQLENEFSGSYSTAMPEAFAIIGRSIRFAPVPSPNSPPLPPQVTDPRLYRNFQVQCYMRFQRIGTSNPTNIILTTYPELYLYGALIEAEPYLIDDERVPVWKTQFEEAVMSINGLVTSGAYSVASVGGRP